MGYATDSQPKTGSRQYGVDIRAHNDEEILLCVVKQGNMDRRIWSADPNAVRQSLEDIRDVYMRFLRSELRGKRLHTWQSVWMDLMLSRFPNFRLWQIS